MEGWILASLLQTSVSHDQLHFDAEKKHLLLLLSMLKTIILLNIFVGTIYITWNNIYIYYNMNNMYVCVCVCIYIYIYIYIYNIL